MSKLIFLLTVAVLLAGCATTGGYERKVASFHGVTEVDLIRVLGTPQQVYDAGERRFITYSSSRFVMVPTAYGNMGNTRSCQTTFELDKGIVVGSSWKGNDCKSR